MARLSIEAKKAIVEKVLAKDGRTLDEIAKMHNISRSTLDRWMKNSQNNCTIKGRGDNNQSLSTAERFEHLIATASLDETALGAYCREHGIYSFQLTQWKETFMSQEESTSKSKTRKAELAGLRAENKQLKQEVRRKDKALAEASALLILKKKAALIWGEPEDD